MTSTSPGRPPPRLGAGRFRIVEPIGDGGTATVYLCWDDETEQWCALKAIQRKFVDDEEMKRRFAQEAEALGRFDHPNIPKLVYHDPEARPPFMVMELARNGSAMDWVRANGPMPPTMAADVLFQVCQALAEAHEAGIVHRDVKPHNFLLDDNGVCKLTDFGIARWTESTSLTATGSQIGTFSFMAPEQRSDTKSVDERADVYSLGASLYTLLTGRTSAELFVADSDDALLEDVHEAFRQVILEATRYRAEDRYPTALVFRNEVMRALSRLPATDADFPPLVRRREPLPEHPPRYLPPDRTFPELEELLEPAPSDSGSPPTPVSVPTREDMLAAIGYRMPRRSVPQTRREMPAGYIVSEEGAFVALPPDEITQNIAAQVKAEVEHAIRDLDDEEDRGPLGIGYVATGILLVALAMVAFIAFTAGAGVAVVAWHRQSTDAAASELVQAMHAEGSIIYDLGRDREHFEAAYNHFRDVAPPQRVDAAIAFVDLLENAGYAFDPQGRQKLNRLRSARDDYQSAWNGWFRAARQFPGNVAIRSRLATAPWDERVPPPRREVVDEASEEARRSEGSQGG